MRFPDRLIGRTHKTATRNLTERYFFIVFFFKEEEFKFFPIEPVFPSFPRQHQGSVKTACLPEPTWSVLLFFFMIDFQLEPQKVFCVLFCFLAEDVFTVEPMEIIRPSRFPFLSFELLFFKVKVYTLAFCKVNPIYCFWSLPRGPSCY